MLTVLRRNKTIAGVLAIFAGTIGLHCFYMGKYKKGLIYLLFFWTGIPTVLGIIDGARLFTQVAEENGSVSDDQATLVSAETVEEADKEEVDNVEEADDAEDVDDIDETEETEEDDEVEEKINRFRNMNSRRKKKCQK